MKKAKQEELLRLLQELTTELAHQEFISRGTPQDSSLFMMTKREKLLERAREAIREFSK